MQNKYNELYKKENKFEYEISYVDIETNKLNNEIENLLEEINNKFISLKNRTNEIYNKLDKKYKEYFKKVVNKEINYEKEIEYKNIKALNIFKNINDFNEYTENLYKVAKWNIQPEDYKTRAEVLKKYSYWDELKNQFNKKKLTEWYLAEEQLVTYFDTMHLMYRILNDIKNQNIKNEMKIIQEYRIEARNKPRADYLLVYRNNIIILEFGKTTMNKIGTDTSNKQAQLNGYEQALRSSLEDEKSINIYGLPLLYISEENEKNIEFNNEQLFDVVKKINKHFIKHKDAFEQLQNAE